MSWTDIQGSWSQVKGKVKETWGKLTDDEIMRINGRREQLCGTLQKQYGLSEADAEDEIERFELECECEHQNHI